MWDEVSRAKAENRRELVLTGKALGARIASTDGKVDPALFQLTGLNFLDLSGCPELSVLSPHLSNLVNLTTLLLGHDGFEELPGEAVAKLTKLKVLDLSANKINTFPEEMVSLANLTTLNLSMNELSSMPSLEGMTVLSHVDLSGNKLTEVSFLCHASLAHLAEISVARNQISSLDPQVSKLVALKKFNVSSNQLKTVPGELADCHKMKELFLGDNPLSDNRLKKMVAQKPTKAVLDYIRQHCPKGPASDAAGAPQSGGKKTKGGKKSSKAAMAAAKEEASVDLVADLLNVLHMQDDSPKVVVEDTTKEIRPYIVCFIVRDVDLKAPKYKQFIQAQTRLHDSICERRNAATIATHDLAKIPKGTVTYTAKSPTELKIAPLGHTKEFDAEKLVAHIRAEAEAQRKEKKRNTISGVHQYLNLLNRLDKYACLVDETGKVISFPPIINAEGTKVSENTKDIFVEVTCGTKLQKAKLVADEVIREMLSLDLGAKDEPDSDDEDEEEMARKQLKVEQVKVVDAEGNMKVVYPSKTDLAFANEAANIRVIRP